MALQMDESYKSLIQVLRCKEEHGNPLPDETVLPAKLFGLAPITAGRLRSLVGERSADDLFSTDLDTGEILNDHSVH